MEPFPQSNKAFLTRAQRRVRLKGVKVLRDLPYADTDNPRQRYRFSVTGKTNRKPAITLVVWIHGGGWRNGDKRSGINRVAPVVTTGRYVGAAARVSTQRAQWPLQIHDCKAAIRWLRAHAREYGIDPERIAVWVPPPAGIW